AVDGDGLLVLRGEGRQPDGLAHPPVDLAGYVEVLGEELSRVLLALAELLTLVGEPRARLLHDLEIDADVEERAFLRDALAVHDVELALAERRRDLVLHDLHPRARADHLGAVLE